MLDTITIPDPELCLAAVRARDIDADGRFIVGVITTGIYCRPSCPSRQARAENLRFFATTAEARNAGLRACKRCRPDEATAVEPQRRVVAAACAALEERDPQPKLDDLAAAAGLSRHHFHRLFSQIMGTTPGAYARAVKLKRLSGALDAGESVTGAVYAAGFGSPSRAYEAARTGLGMTPGARRRNGAGETIRYAVAETSLGPMLLAASRRGICATAFDDDGARLVAHLKQRFSAATLVEDAAGLTPWIAALSDHLHSPAQALDLPLDIQGTAFQARVWQALRDIPPGKTASYAEIAKALGRPSAVRAVARACASNAIAILIPCHRVLRQDGSLSGYRWGPARKRALLEAETEARASRADVVTHGPS